MYSAKYTINCIKRSYKDSSKYCESKGKTIASFHSKADINLIIDQLTCNAYIGAESDGLGNWKWYDGSKWWKYGVNDGLLGYTETKIVWVASDKKWHDWESGSSLQGVICGPHGNIP